MKRLLALFATIMPLVFTTATRADLRDGLVGYWPFDGDAKDYSGNGNHGSTHGVSLTSDRHGNASSAYHFDGSDYISASASSSLNDISSAITIAAWIKPTAWDNHNENGDNLSEWIPVLQKGNEDRIQFQFMHARVGTTGWVRVDVSQEASIENARMPTIGVWQFVALTLSSGYLKYYRNGALSDSQYVGITLSRNSDPLFIGMDPWNVREYFTGNIDEISIYNRALTDSEIHALYNGNLKVCTISFVANGGEGNMAAQKPLTGTTLALPANTFTREGYIFQGWATSPDGPVVYSDGAEITVDSDKTLYAVWKAEGGMIQLSVARADPAAGSLTLAWEEEKSIEGMTYSVWRGTGDERSAAVCVAPSVTGNTWTDEEYWKAEPVLEPLRYWVVAAAGGKNERESNCVETRHRYGVFVGVGKYKNSNSPDPSDISNAELFAQLARGKGGFIVEAKDILTGSGAKKKAVRQAVQALAGKMQTGDYAVLFFSSHGDSTFWNRVGNKLDSDVKLNFASVAMYDGDYEKKEMASDLEMFMAGKNGVGVVVVLNSCLSGGAVDAVSADGQIAWITSCRDGEITPSWTATFGTPLPQFLLRYGWNRGRAGSGEFVTFGELADYALPELDAFLKKTLRSNHPVVKGEKVLAHFVAGRHGSAAHATVPTVPSGMNATTEEASLRVSWEGQSDADWFILQRSTVPETTQIAGVIEGTSEGGPDTSADLYGKSYFYRVAAMNEWGISGWSDSVTGSRHNPELVEWVKQQCGCDDSASPATLAAAAASTSANGASYEACYVTGIDPNDPSAAFKAELTREGGIWNVEPSGGRKAGRLYRVEGKKTMSDEVWTNVTGVEDLEAEGWHFFRVGVELAE